MSDSVLTVFLNDFRYVPTRDYDDDFYYKTRTDSMGVVTVEVWQYLGDSADDKIDLNTGEVSKVPFYLLEGRMFTYSSWGNAESNLLKDWDARGMVGPSRVVKRLYFDGTISTQGML